MTPLLFDLLSLIYALQALRVLVTLYRRWSAFWDATFTPEDWRLAQEIGVFLVIPIGVLLHELGHGWAARALGARVLGLHYRLFWGYVTYEGALSPAAHWGIALAGNLVSVAFGVLLALSGYYGRGLPLPARYTLLYAGQVQTVFALVAYPLLSFAGFEGDWVTIYDFERTPVLSTVALVGHVAGFIAAATWWRRHVSPRGRA